MKLSANLKQWLVENAEMAADADDPTTEKCVADCFVDGSLSRDKYVELTTDEAAKGHDTLTATMQKLVDMNVKLAERLDAMENGGTKSEGSPLSRVLSKAGSDGGSGMPNVNVKGAWDRYSDTKSAALYPQRTKATGAPHPMAGQHVVDGSGSSARNLDELSERDKACAGVFFKWLLACEKGANVPPVLRFHGDPKSLNGETHDEQIMQYMLHECKWGGNIGGEGSEMTGVVPVVNRRLSEFEMKQVIDDTTSGGQYITPIMFDDNVVLPTLLYGEFYPRVTVVPMTRGRRVESGTMGTLTVTSGGGDGTNITLTTTTSFITAFNTTIFTADLGIDLGLDFLSDSPVDVAGLLTRQAGEVMMKHLDDIICTGNGTTQAEGITVASGTTTVTHSSAAPTIGVYVQHLLNVGKEYAANTPMNQLCFGGTQTSYRRARSIAVGASDARLIFGNTGLGSYTLFDGYPYGINASLGNTKIFFGNMRRYRMYRRLGLEMRMTTEGRTNVLANKMTLVGRFRFGGQVEDAAAFTVATDGQA